MAGTSPFKSATDQLASCIISIISHHLLASVQTTNEPPASSASAVGLCRKPRPPSPHHKHQLRASAKATTALPASCASNRDHTARGFSISRGLLPNHQRAASIISISWALLRNHAATAKILVAGSACKPPKNKQHHWHPLQDSLKPRRNTKQHRMNRPASSASAVGLYRKPRPPSSHHQHQLRASVKATTVLPASCASTPRTNRPRFQHHLLASVEPPKSRQHHQHQLGVALKPQSNSKHLSCGTCL